MANESDIAAEVEHLKRQQALIVRAVQISLSLILLTLAGTCVRAALVVPAMTDIFRDLTPDMALPVVTQLVMAHPRVFLMTAVLLAALGLGLLFFSRAKGLGIVAATVVIVVLFVQWQVVVSAMQSPFMQILSRLAEPAK